MRVMGQVIDFEQGAVAQLRERCARAEEDSQDLLAFARGHSGAAGAIHEAVLAIMAAQGLDHLIHIVTREWPQTLGVDAVSLALHVGDTGIQADSAGMRFVEPRLIAASAGAMAGVVLHDVGRGHPLFGAAAQTIRTEALIAIAGEPPLPSGLLALGQRTGEGIDAQQGAELLDFLGRSLALMIGRWLLD